MITCLQFCNTWLFSNQWTVTIIAGATFGLINRTELYFKVLLNFLKVNRTRSALSSFSIIFFNNFYWKDTDIQISSLQTYDSLGKCETLFLILEQKVLQNVLFSKIYNNNLREFERNRCKHFWMFAFPYFHFHNFCIKPVIHV